MSYLERVNQANGCNLSHFRPFVVDRRVVGYVRHCFAERLRQWSNVFTVHDNRLTLSAPLEAADLLTRSAAVAQVVARLGADGEFAGHWWDENFSVDAGYGTAPSLLLERAALQHFGVTGYGVHLNGYVRDAGELKMWVAKRSLSKPTGPGKLDQMVAGGHPAGISLPHNMTKECAEEAGMGADLAATAKLVSAVSYCLENEVGLRPDVLFVFDCELPVDFVPDNVDGEVEEFFLWPIEQVADTVRNSDAFKFNCALVVIDFLLRHGQIAPDNPDYLALQAGLRRREHILAGIAAFVSEFEN